MQKVFNVVVDIGRKLPAPAFEVNTNDLKSVKLLITITNGQTQLDLTDTTVRIAIRKPDNNILFQDCTVKDAANGQVEIILENQAYIMAGTHTAEIMCYKGSDVVAVSGTFSYKSTKGILNDEAVESKSEFTTITGMLKDVQDTIKDFRENGTGIDAKARADIEKNTAQLAGMPKTVNNIAPDEEGNIQIPVQDIDTSNLATKTEVQALASGSPKAVSRVSEMTDLTKNYVYTGNETGYTPGNWYHHNGTSWVSGGVYLSDSLELAQSRKVLLLKGTNAIPNYTSSNNSLTIYTDTVVVYGSQSFVTTKNQVIQFSGNSKLVFNTSTKEFRAIYFRDPLLNEEVVLCTAKSGNFPYIFDASFSFTIDDTPVYASSKDIPNLVPQMFRNANVLLGGNNLPYLDQKNQKFIFPANQFDYMVCVGSEMYTSAVPSGGLTLDLPTTGSSAQLLLFKISDKSFQFVPYSDALQYRNTHALVGTLRRMTLWSFTINLPFPFLIDGKLYGVSGSVPTGVIQNPLDAFVKGILHRGYNTDAPENTIPAYRLGKQKGFSYVEADVEWTSDNIPVLLHDGTVNRTGRNADGTPISTANLAISSLTLAQAKEYDFGIVKNPIYAGTKIPTFEEFILFCKKNSLHPYIEIKGSLTDEQAQILFDIVKKFDMTRKSSWISFTFSSLEKIKKIDPKARLGYVGTLSDDLIGYAKILKNDTNEVFLNSNEPITENLIKKSINEGIPVEMWTVNDPAKVHSLVGYGVSGISTDGLNVAEILQTT